MSKTRRKLKAMSDKCQAMCDKSKWKEGFHLLYSSVESYEDSNGIAIIGLNPAGGPQDNDPKKLTLPFECPGYSAYLDDTWRNHERGQAPLQRVIQGIAMVISGKTASEAILAIQDPDLTPEERMGTHAEAILRRAVTGNIIPFRDSKLDDLPSKLRARGPEFGWQLLRSMRPKPQIIVTLANGEKAPIWKTILENSRQPLKADYEKWVNQDMNRKYREVRIVNKPLKGALVIGLPGVVRDHSSDIRKDIAKPMFKVLARRLRHHGLL